MIFFNKEIENISCDSRLCDEKSFFFCIRGFAADGHKFASDAYMRGCRLFGAEEDPGLPEDAEVIFFDDTRKAMAVYSAQLYGYPSRKLKVVGVTGTKGKSTVSTLIWQTLNRNGKKAVLIGTTGVSLPGEHIPTSNTTPESNLLHEYLYKAVKEGCAYAVVEVSSQAEKLDRVYGIDFDISVFTNLSPDHIGTVEHADYSEYRLCKGKLFSASALSVINTDDKEAEFFASMAKGKVVTYGSVGDADWFAQNIRPEREKFGMTFKVKGKELTIPLAGSFSVSNALAAMAVCSELGLGDDEIFAALESTPGTPGRMEYIDLTRFGVTDRKFIIDYAHNGLSLESALETLRPYCTGRLICLFGSVGSRTEHRREELAEACKGFADYAIVTSDNPDRENPEKIISEISAHLGSFPHECITDRAEAIKYAFDFSKKGDIVLLAGKGHEDYQLICGEKVPFSEKNLLITIAKTQNRHN